MDSIIKILPSHIANQIAAGEVVQRPASVVKELMENSIDAGAGRIKLIVEDGGRSLIQVIDDGKGMSPEDAKLSFSRHATSKISSAEDLFTLQTKGFRGEALASIAAVAQVKLTSRRKEDGLATEIEIEGSEFTGQREVNAPQGTNTEVKNLFFNIPARRAFLKNDTLETGKIIDEFQRLAIAHPEIGFELYRNGSAFYQLPPSSLRRRIVSIFKGNTDNKLIPVDEETAIVKFSGFVYKPEFAKQKAGEQFLFINRRFVKSPYFAKAVVSAYQDLIPEKYYPSYFIFFETDPSLIDVNIHPQKTEVSMQDESTIFTFLRTSIRAALGKYSINTTLDFDQDQDFNRILDNPIENAAPPKILFDPNYNPFDDNQKTARSSYKAANIPDYQNRVFEITEEPEELFKTEPSEPSGEKKSCFLLNGKYIAANLNGGVILVEPARASVRICYERLLRQVLNKTANSQQLLFPLPLNLDEKEILALNDMEQNLWFMGFQLGFDKGTILLTGIPQQLDQSQAQAFLEKTAGEISAGEPMDKNTLAKDLARKLSSAMAIKDVSELSADAQKELVDELLACKEPKFTPSGKPCYIEMDIDELDRKFR